LQLLSANFGPLYPLSTNSIFKMETSRTVSSYESASIAILDIGRMNDGVEQQATVSTRMCRFLPLIFLPAS